MKKILAMLGLTAIIIVTLSGCGILGERRYGEGDVVRVLLNPPTNDTFMHMNFRVFNDTNETQYFQIEGFEIQSGDYWELIPPSANEEWMFEKRTLTPQDTDGAIFTTTLGFEYWLNQDYPTTGEFRVRVSVVDRDGNYLFTQVSNVRTIENFRFE